LRPGNILGDAAVQAEWDTVFTFLLGRYGQINSAFNNDRNLQPLPQGTGNNRHYRYYETEVYLQDTWQARKDLTLTYGLRYQYYSVPYEADGLEAIPNVDFNRFFSVRAHNGPRSISGPFSVPVISYNFGGKANDATGLYHPDWRDFAPRFSFAYNPSFASGALGRLFGDRKMVIRGGAGVVFDHPGTNALNFVQDQNTYIFQNTTTTVFGEDPDPATNLANDPRFTDINHLPPLIQPDPVTVPFAPFVDSNGVPFGAQAVTFNYAIDPKLKTPYSITFSFGVQRELPANFVLEANYFGRLGRRLLAQSDAGQVVDFRDPASGQFLAAAFAQTARELRAGAAVTPQPFWENQIQEAIGTDCTTAFGAPSCTELIASALGGLIVRGDLADTVQALDFFQVLVPGVGLSPQFDTNVYVTNQSFSSYNGLLATLHKKASHGLQFDLNYTYAHSIDNVSVVANAPFADFVCDVSRLRLCRGTSDFDATHVISVNAIYELPFGRGKQFGGNARGWFEQVIGGWQLSGINTWRTGLPWRTSTEAFPIGFANDVPAIFNGDQAAVAKDVHVDPATGAVQYFVSPSRALGAFRGPLGLEAGQRNLLRGPSFFLLDLALSKKFPITERIGLEFRAEAYNAFNHVNFSLPSGNDIFQPSQFGQITTTASSAREMQFALRLKF